MGRTIYLENCLYTVQLGVTCTKTDLLGHRLETGERLEPFLSLSYSRPLYQNGYDFSPIAVVVMMVLFTKAPEYAPHPWVKTPHLECVHATWSRMLVDLTKGIQGSYALWNHPSSSGHRFESKKWTQDCKQDYLIGMGLPFQHNHQYFLRQHPKKYQRQIFARTGSQKNKGWRERYVWKIWVEITIFFGMVSQIKDAKKQNIFHDIDNPGVLKWKVFDNNVQIDYKCIIIEECNLV